MNKTDILSFLKKEKRELKKLFSINKIGLYGSYARGQQNENSDIDLVYILDKKHQFGYFEYLELSDLLSKQFHKKVELVNYNYMNPLIKFKAERDIIYA